MANPRQVELLREGAAAWNAWNRLRKENPELRPDLCEAKLDGADLRQTDLRQADLQEANLAGVNLRQADLGGADLRRSDLRQANLAGASLRQANLDGADLIRANLIGANLSRADLSYSSAGWTIFGRVDLSVAKGLDQVRHSGPSTIGIDTIYQSKGQISEHFLRGAGVPDNFIVFAKSLLANPIEFYSCFISYSTQDQDFADRLYADLQAKGVRCWYSPQDAQRGRKLHEQIDEAIRMHEKLLLILSLDSMKSNWV